MKNLLKTIALFFKKTYLTIFVISIVISIIRLGLINYWKYIEASSLLSSTFANLFSDAILLVVTAALIPWYQDYYLNRPSLKIIDPTSGESFIKVRKSHTPNNQYTLNLALRNDGRKPILNKWYWHIIIPEIIHKSHVKTDNVKDWMPKCEIIQNDGKKMMSIHGSSSSPIYSKSIFNFFELTFLAEHKMPEKIYCYLSTEFGYIPKSAYKYNEAFALSKGKELNFEHFTSIALVIE